MSELNVAAQMRIMPTGVDADFKSLEKKIEGIVGKYGKVHKTEIKPLAFGLKSLEVTLLLSDKDGGIDEIEVGISKLPGVGSVETTEVNRL